MSDVDRARLLAVIAQLSFRVAKTMPDVPHEYTVRVPDNEAAYVELAQAILEHGVIERYGRRRQRYLYPGDDRKYWLMTTQVRHSRVLNRAWAANYGPDNVPVPRPRT